MAVQWGLKEFKSAFFDAEGVKKKVDAATRKVLSKVGAFIRQRARTSIRKRAKISQPGQPPSSHEGSLKRLIFFAYDGAAKSVVIGPTAFGTGTAPRLLENGGDTTRRYKSGKTVAQHYRPRPFMRPAGEAEAVKLKPLLKGMVN